MTPEEEKRYVDYMTDIKNRIDFLQNTQLQMPAQVVAEIYALQLRKIVEGVVFSSLTANREKYSELHANFARHWRIRPIIKSIKTFNNEYLPIPVLEIERDGQPAWDYPKGAQFFTEDNLIEIYDDSSAIIHSEKPF